MQGFNRDIVDYGYYIRTKDADGTARLVTEQDLGNYVRYMGVDEGNECPARLATDLIAYGEPLTNDCGSGYGSIFDQIAPATHYYNYPIVWDYHMAAIGNALVYGYPTVARKLLEGFVERVDVYLDPDTEEPGAEHSDWSRDMAIMIVQAAAVGLPLTAAEARLVHQHWSQAADELEVWPRWDLWEESVPDGEYWAGGGFRPSVSHEAIPVESFALFLETCSSPFLNPASAAFVDCDVVRDVTAWGEE